MREGQDPRSALRRRATRSQATLEFAFVLPLFLVCFLASIDAGLWAVQNSAEVAAVEQAARLGAAAGAQPAGPPPDARTVTAGVVPRLRQALFATRIVSWCDPAAASPCAPASSAACAGNACRFATCPTSPAAVEAVFGARTVALCVEQHTPPACPRAPAGTAAASPYCTDTPMVTVRLVGHVASLVPPGFGFGGSAGEIPTDVGVTTHTLRFAP